MQRTLNDQEDELCRFFCHLRDLTEELRELHRRVPVACPVEIVDLTRDDNKGRSRKTVVLHHRSWERLRGCSRGWRGEDRWSRGLGMRKPIM